MLLLVSFLPWIIFWVVLYTHNSEPAALAGFLSMLVVLIYRHYKGRTLKALEIMTLCNFIFLAIVAAFTELDKFSRWIPVWNHSLLAGLVLVSLLVKKPFTLQYAREMVPRQSQDDPLFIKANYVISRVWLAIFLLFVALPVSRLLGFGFPRLVNLIIMILGTIGAVKFTFWYSVRLRRQE